MGSSQSIFHDVIGQRHATGLLQAALDRDRVSHAYLFFGPRGTGKLKAAGAFAAALACGAGGCGECPTCLKAARGSHPDISIVKPTGAFITVDQIRDINRTVFMHPGESEARVFIITDAGAFNSESANAFLKTLEEPPPYAFFILLARSRDRVLPTVLSRCQPVRFGPVPPAEIEAALRDDRDISETMAQTFARVSCGDLGLARELAADEALMERRRSYIEVGRRLARGEGDPFESAGIVLSAAAAAGEEAETALEQAPEGFETASGRQLKQDAHRRARAARIAEVSVALEVLGCWFRDMLTVAVGAPEAVINRDYELELEQEAHESRSDAYRAAAEAVNATRAKLDYNIDLELALMALFHRLQEVL